MLGTNPVVQPVRLGTTGAAGVEIVETVNAAEVALVGEGQVAFEVI